MRSHWLGLAALTLALPLLLAACKGKKAPPPDEHPPEAQLPERPAVTAQPKRLDAEALSAVCDGKAEPRARAYDKNAAAAHSMIALLKDAGDTRSSTYLVHDLNRFTSPKVDESEVVICITRTPAKEKSISCAFDTKKPTHYLDLYDASFEVSIREAKTAAVLASKTFDRKNTSCPTIHSFRAERDVDYPRPDEVITLLAVPLLLPATVTGEVAYPRPLEGRLLDLDLRDICLGLPEPRAAAYEKKPGKISPTGMASRHSEEERYNTDWTYALTEWKAQSADQYELVICSTEKSRTKKGECKFPSHLLDVYSATYESTLREARTAKILATKTITIPAMTCPLSWSFRGAHDIHVPEPDKELKAPFGSFVGGK